MAHRWRLSSHRHERVYLCVCSKKDLVRCMQGVSLVWRLFSCPLQTIKHGYLLRFLEKDITKRLTILVSPCNSGVYDPKSGWNPFVILKSADINYCNHNPCIKHNPLEEKYFIFDKGQIKGQTRIRVMKMRMKMNHTRLKQALLYLLISGSTWRK